MSPKLPRGTLDRLWNDPANWTKKCQGTPFSFRVYCCKEDPRIVVPKLKKWQGWMPNSAHMAKWASFCTAWLVALVLSFAGWLEWVKSLQVFHDDPLGKGILICLGGYFVLTVIAFRILVWLASPKRFED